MWFLTILMQVQVMRKNWTVWTCLQPQVRFTQPRVNSKAEPCTLRLTQRICRNLVKRKRKKSVGHFGTLHYLPRKVITVRAYALQGGRSKACGLNFLSCVVWQIDSSLTESKYKLSIRCVCYHRLYFNSQSSWNKKHSVQVSAGESLANTKHLSQLSSLMDSLS